MNRYLIIVDMQKDFIDGSLGTKEAQAIVEKVTEKAKNFDGTLIFTRDTHQKNYMDTQEGKNLPISHCIEGEDGWELTPTLAEIAVKKNAIILNKPTFASVALGQLLEEAHKTAPIHEIVLVGLCTDICVISNALLCKGFLPDVPIAVDASCCAGVTPQSHQNALEAMKVCQIAIQ